MKHPAIAHGTRNMASWLPENRLTRKVALTDAMGIQTPRIPEIRPRCPIGTWSGSTATMAASSALKSSWAMHQPTRRIVMSGARATMRMPREPPTRPMTIHGRRMPKRDDVRSLSLPKIGFANMANSAPVPATSARLLGACWIPTSEFTFNARVTSRGARNSRLVLMKASVYSAMKPQPTRSGAAASSSKLAAATHFAVQARPGQVGRVEAARVADEDAVCVVAGGYEPVALVKPSRAVHEQRALVEPGLQLSDR